MVDESETVHIHSDEEDVIDDSDVSLTVPLDVEEDELVQFRNMPDEAVKQMEFPSLKKVKHGIQSTHGLGDLVSGRINSDDLRRAISKLYTKNLYAIDKV